MLCLQFCAYALKHTIDLRHLHEFHVIRMSSQVSVQYKRKRERVGMRKRTESFENGENDSVIMNVSNLF